MLRFLFPSLTADPERGAPLLAWVTAQARRPHWYLDGRVADSIDGRFAMVATIAALVSVRLERDGERGAAAQVALTERFIEVMKAEHREIGLGDPKLGRTVRKLVGALARRIALWRAAVAGDGDWNDTSRASIYGDAPVAAAALDHSAARLRMIWEQLDAASAAAIAEGRIA